MKTNSARLFGIFFVLSFISYSAGTELMGIVQNPQTLPAEILESKTSLVSGAILMALFHTLFNSGLIVIMFSTLKRTYPSLSLIYLVLSAFGTLMLAAGAVFLLLPVPLSETMSQPNNMDFSLFSLILDLSSGGNFYAYQFGMAIWGAGGLVLCYLLYASKLVPAIFPLCGYIGYSVFIAGCILELSGLSYGVVCSVPGGLFEIALSIRLIIKGFNHDAAMTTAQNSKI